MTEFDTEMLAVVDELLNEFGRTVTLLNTTAPPANEDEPWNGPAEFDDLTADAEHRLPDVKAVFIGELLALTRGAVTGKNTTFLDGLLTKYGSDIFLVSGSHGTDLSKFDKLIDNEYAWTIKTVVTIHPGDTVFLYALQVSR